jgi:hypothetical protein
MDTKLDDASITDKKNGLLHCSRNGDIQFSFCIVTFGPPCISKTVLGSSHLWFCREFQALSFEKKKNV